MPTPSDDTVVQSAPIPVDEDVRRCPPEESRAPNSRREDAGVEDDETTADTPSAGAEQSPEPQDDREHDVQMQRDEQHDAPTLLRPPQERRKYREEPEDLVLETSSPTVGSPDVPSDSDVRLAQSMSSAAISPESNDATPAPMYLSYPELQRDRCIGPNSTTSFLRPGSKFRGTQQSDRQVYDVQVELKDVDMEESRLCGYLRIQGLTDDHPTLTTFFEGEIVGPHYLFRTSHPSWGSSEKVDLQHWARFPAWRPLAKQASKNPHFTLRNPWEKEHLFMRWKEYFLVPDHRVKQISGASFEGFYYICFDQRNGGVSGIYFHSKSEKYQQLELRWVDDGGRVPGVEFR